jgi:hypothetical protein
VDDSSICASPPQNDDSAGSPGVSNESEDAVSEPLDFSKKRRRKQHQEQIVPQISVPDDASSMLGVDCFPAFPSVPPLFPGPLPPALPLLGLLMRHAATVSAAAAAAGRTFHGESGVSDGDLIVSSSSEEQLSSVPAQDQYACFRQRFFDQLSQQQQQQQQQQVQQLAQQQRQQQQQDEEDHLSNSATSPTSSLDLKGLAYLERRKDILSTCY